MTTERKSRGAFVFAQSLLLLGAGVLGYAPVRALFAGHHGLSERWRESLCPLASLHDRTREEEHGNGHHHDYIQDQDHDDDHHGQEPIGQSREEQPVSPDEIPGC